MSGGASVSRILWNLSINSVLVMGSLLFVLGGAEFVLRFLPVTDIVLTRPLKSNAEPFDVSSKPHSAHTYSHGAGFRNARIRKTNNLGFFSDFDFIRGARVDLAIGDSYVEALQVNFESSFHQVYARRGSRRVYPLAVSGNPLSQYQAYLEQACETFRVSKALITIAANDFDESFHRYRTRDGFFHYYHEDGHIVLKPTPFEVTTIRAWANGWSLVRYVYFHLNGGRLWCELFPRTGRFADLEVNSVRRLATAKAAVDAFLGRVGNLCMDRSDLLFLVDADRPSIYGGPPDGYFKEMRGYFIERAGSAGFRVLDLQPVFAEDFAVAGQRFEFPFDAHWNQYAHALVGAKLNEILR